jgi:two-component system nitrate/nitrite response regulator NarL
LPIKTASGTIIAKVPLPGHVNCRIHSLRCFDRQVQNVRPIITALGSNSLSSGTRQREYPKTPRTFNRTNPNISVVRILTAADCPILLDGMRALLQTNPEFKVVGEASDGEMLLDLVREGMSDILLLDWALTRQSDMRVLREIASSEPSVPTLLVIVSPSPDNAEILNALKLGVWGVVTRRSTTQMLFEGIYKVVAGQYWMENEGVASLVEALRDFERPTRNQNTHRNFGLTPREIEVIATIVAGYSNLDIAEKLLVSEHTVKHHIGHIFDKLGVSNRLELALFAVNHQLTSESS